MVLTERSIFLAVIKVTRANFSHFAARLREQLALG